ncbi:hypothetical protein AXG93_723s1150 [Marchantia polymorpha subsp. ruderalis]|uniref:Uncharacterized protein n=1 Tax=Marchantia polymorpha subsp. ruderalis TaxID=1480154 RepID=A0A176VCL3_MARPO|nr:hypothetical protein AXG93_723s1150 [Marchantia polymorpha subsp. ruderalis]
MSGRSTGATTTRSRDKVGARALLSSMSLSLSLSLPLDLGLTGTGREMSRDDTEMNSDPSEDRKNHFVSAMF